MKHLILVSICSLGIFAQIAYGQLFGGAVIATARSKSFKHFAAGLNDLPGTIKKLNNFNFAYGYTWGIEIPFSAAGVGLGFRFQKLNSSALYTNSYLGEQEYHLTQKQYLVPISIVNISDLGNFGLITSVQFPIGISKTNIEQRLVQSNGSTTVTNFKNSQMNFGFQLQLALITKSYFGFSMRAGYLGSFIPMRALKFDLSNYEDGPINLEYSYKDELRNVKADNRNLSFELSLQWMFILAMMK